MPRPSLILTQEFTALKNPMNRNCPKTRGQTLPVHQALPERRAHPPGQALLPGRG